MKDYHEPKIDIEHHTITYDKHNYFHIHRNLDIKF